MMINITKTNQENRSLSPELPEDAEPSVLAI